MDVELDKFEIHTDFENGEFSEMASILEPGMKMEARKEINKRPTSDKDDLRPRAVDSKGVSYLVDTGAAVSCYPVSKLGRMPQSDPQMTLTAVNGSTIKTFGKQTFRFKLGTLSFTHTFIVSEISQAVLGWDWIKKFQLDLKWDGPVCRLSKGQKSIRLELAPAKQELLGLAAVGEDGASFKTWSQVRNTEDEPKPDDIPQEYETLLQSYPNIDKPDFRATPAHGVQHHIDTGNHPPCKAKVRKLLPGSPKEVLGKKKWLEMEKLGI